LSLSLSTDRGDPPAAYRATALLPSLPCRNTQLHTKDLRRTDPPRAISYTRPLPAPRTSDFDRKASRSHTGRGTRRSGPTPEALSRALRPDCRQSYLATS